MWPSSVTASTAAFTAAPTIEKELDPNNRASVVLGSVAFYLDRMGYQVLPLAMRMLRGETVPARSVTPHKLITPANVFAEYPPYDMN